MGDKGTKMTSTRYRYEIEYFVTDNDGKRKKKREVEFTKPKETWKNSDWDTLDKYLRIQERSKRCDVSVIDIKPIKFEN